LCGVRVEEGRGVLGVVAKIAVVANADVELGEWVELRCGGEEGGFCGGDRGGWFLVVVGVWWWGGGG